MSNVPEVKERTDSAVKSLRDALGSLLGAQEEVGMLAADPFPTEFTGVVHQYRYGKDDPYSEGMPSHSFKLECEKGLWLYVSCGSVKFEDFLVGTDIDTLTRMDESMNGMGVKVQRDPTYGRMFPVALLGKPLTLRDKNGVLLFKGDILRRNSEIAGPILSEEVDKSIITIDAGGTKKYYNYDLTKIG